MRGLITANLKFLGTYPNDNDELIIAKRGSMTSGSTSFSSLDGIGFPVAQLVEHGANNAKIMGSIPRESKSWSNVKL